MINSEIGMVTDQTHTPGTSGTLEQDIREKFRSSGYTLTSQRRAVLEALKEAKGHPSAEDIYLMVKKKNPRVALGTVYQALSVLEEIGVLDGLEEAIRKNTPYQVTRATMVVEGLCPSCRT